MNKKHLLVLSSLTALFVVACADASSSSVAPSSSSSTSTPSSSVSSSVSSSSSMDSDDTWGIINGDFEDESDVFTFQSAGWNEFIGGEVDGIVAATTYETEGDNQYGALSIESIADQTQWWHAQLRQNGVYLYNNGSYILSFKVRAAAARTIRVQIQGGGLTSKPTSLNEVAIPVTTSWQTKTINFTAPSDAVNAELQFGIGPDSYLPSDLVGFARSFADVHLDDVAIEIGEPLPNQAPTISGGDVVGQAGELLLVKSGLTVRDDYDTNLALADVTAIDVTNGTKLNAAAPVAGFYTYTYVVTDSEGLVGTHTRNIIITNPDQLLNNTQFTQWGNAGMPAGWTKWNEDNNGGQRVTAGVMPHLLPESLLGNIANGDFSDGSENFSNTAGWKTFIADEEVDGIAATMGITDGVGVFTTTASTAATHFWHGQIRQENIRLPQGDFTLEFRAKTSEARTIRVALAGGNIVSTGRAINEVPVVLTTEWDTYTLEFTAQNHAYGALLQFFTGPDQLLPSELAALYANKTGTVYLDDVVIRYEDAQSPVATMVPTLAVDLWRIADAGNPWENQVKYEKLPFYEGDYTLNFKAYADEARPIILAMEGNGGVDQPNLYRTVELTTTPQAFSYDIEFIADSVNSSKNIQFFMGSFSNFETFNEWWPGLDPVGVEDNIETMVYLFDFSLDKVA
jgi:hypothetical protein